MAAVPTHTNTLSKTPAPNTGTELVDLPCDFVARDSGQCHTGKGGVDDKRVTVTDATGLNPNSDLSRSRFRNWYLYQLERPRIAHLRGIHQDHCCPPR